MSRIKFDQIQPKRVQQKTEIHAEKFETAEKITLDSVNTKKSVEH